MFSPISRREQMRQLGQHIGNVENARLQGLLPREGQQLAHQIGGAVGVLLDLHDVGKGLVARRDGAAAADRRSRSSPSAGC